MQISVIRVDHSRSCSGQAWVHSLTKACLLRSTRVRTVQVAGACSHDSSSKILGPVYPCHPCEFVTSPLVPLTAQKNHGTLTMESQAVNGKLSHLRSRSSHPILP